MCARCGGEHHQYNQYMISVRVQLLVFEMPRVTCRWHLVYLLELLWLVQVCQEVPALGLPLRSQPKIDSTCLAHPNDLGRIAFATVSGSWPLRRQ